MPAGARPLPPEIKKTRGYVNNDKPKYPIPARVGGVPVAPPWLDEYAMECWEWACYVLLSRGQISMDGFSSLVALCQCWGDWRRLTMDIKENGFTHMVEVATTGGLVEKARPQVAMRDTCDNRLRAWLCEFGLTDSSRGKVNASPGLIIHENDPLAEFGLSS